MVVVAIMGIIMTMSVPSIYRVWRQESLRKATSEAQEVCMNARARAILSGTMTEIVFRADPPVMEVSGAGSAAAGSGLSAQLQLGGDIGVESIKVNGVECKDRDLATVRFFPNGTCDELRLILLRPTDGQRRGVFLEVTTALADVVTDQNRLTYELR